MKLKFIIIGLNEQYLVKEAHLSSIGLDTYSDSYVMGVFVQEFESELEAIQWIMDNKDYIAANYEYGVEIKKVFK